MPNYLAQAASPDGGIGVGPLARERSGEERQFQSWIRSLPWWSEYVAEYGEEPQIDGGNYDYRAAWKAGLEPERSPYDNGRHHWPSSTGSGQMLKSPDHPTAWKERYMRSTGKNPDALGINKLEGLQHLKRGR
tara:strand:- start:175 stop:573 length:399 start_codon:yes stop_codon:yes gene_type:complete